MLSRVLAWFGTLPWWLEIVVVYLAPSFAIALWAIVRTLVDPERPASTHSAEAKVGSTVSKPRVRDELPSPRSLARRRSAGRARSAPCATRYAAMSKRPSADREAG